MNGNKNQLPISEYQKRFYLEWAMAPNETTYNSTAVYKIIGKLDQAALKKACEEFIKNNEVMCAQYSKDGNKCWRKKYTINDIYKETILKDDIPVEIQVEEITNKPFDLINDVLIRFYLLKDSTIKNKSYFVFCAHHIIADATCLFQFGNQIQNSYNLILSNSYSVDQLKLKFTKAVYAEQKIITQKYKNKAKKYWLDFIGDFPLNINLPICSPTDHTDLKNAQSDKSGESVVFELTNSQTNKLKAFALREKTTVFVVIAALYGLVISKYCSQKKLLISYPVNMRSPGFKDATGCFVNNIPLKFDFEKYETLKQIINMIDTQRREVMLYQGYSFTDIIQDQRKYKKLDLDTFLNVGLIPTNLFTITPKLNNIEVIPVDLPLNFNSIYQIELLYVECFI